MMPSYSEYKDSGIEWIGKIPAGWEVKRFCHLFSFSHGVHITKSDFREKGVLCVTYGDIHSKGSSELNSNIHGLHSIDPAFLENEQNAKLKKGDFIFADTSEDREGAGNFTYLNSDITIMAGYHTIIAKPQQSESTRFLSYFFDSLGFRSQIRSRVYGVKVFSITKSILKNTKILLPPLAEQEAIAAYLDKKLSEIDTAVSNLQIQVEKLRTYKQQLIAETVTRGLDKTSVYKDSGIEWIGRIPAGWNVVKAKHIFNQRVNKGNEKVVLLAASQALGMIPQDKIEGAVKVKNDTNLQTFKTVCKNDFVISLRSFQGGFEISKYEGVCSPAYKVFYSISEICHRYFKRLFKSTVFISKMNSIASGIRDGRNIAYEDFSQAYIPFPPLAEQEAIAAYLDEKTTLIDTLIADIHRQIEQLKKYRKIIIHDAVTGRVKVPEVQNENY